MAGRKTTAEKDGAPFRNKSAPPSRNDAAVSYGKLTTRPVMQRKTAYRKSPIVINDALRCLCINRDPVILIKIKRHSLARKIASWGLIYGHDTSDCNKQLAYLRYLRRIMPGMVLLNGDVDLNTYKHLTPRQVCEA